MSKQVLWVIKQKHNDYVFTTFKAAKASPIGWDEWSEGVRKPNSIRIIARVVLDKFRKRKQKATND
jgi:hypothetical protein